jgi:hypothetical protein
MWKLHELVAQADSLRLVALMRDRDRFQRVLAGYQPAPGVSTFLSRFVL